jgi:hypothetical protein
MTDLSSASQNELPPIKTPLDGPPIVFDKATSFESANSKTVLVT